ncbi:Malectin [Gracilaria domingensis]|nr:Malectin [Gracilaria domingensis]
MNSVYLVCFLVLASCSFRLSASAKVEWKINLGGEPTNGFQAEEAILNVDENLAKMRYHGQIKGAGTDLNVFKTQRFSRAEDLVINFPVPDGVYTVTLMFAETWKGAYGSGNRVFDVYLGSKPGGVIKVIDQMDPFRSGGPAGPVRRKFSGIATQGGLTLALRPIKQNPQIAGIVINGYSYGNSFMEDLPTVSAGPFEGGDFGSLNSVGPRTPADSSLVYDPSLNPKFKASNKPLPPGNSPSQGFTMTAQDANPSTPSGTVGQRALPNPFGTSQNAQTTQSTQGTNGGSIATPGLSSPYSNTAYGASGSSGATVTGELGVPGSSQPQTLGRPAPVAVGSVPFGAPPSAPQGAVQYRSFRRRLASYYGEGSPVNFPVAPNSDVGDNTAVPDQAARNQAYPDQVETISSMLTPGEQPVAVNEISNTPLTSLHDATSQSVSRDDAVQGMVGEVQPPSISETMPSNFLEHESSRAQGMLEPSSEQEQASAQKEALSQSPLSPLSDLQTPVNIGGAHEDIATAMKGRDSLPSEMSPATAEGFGNFQGRALPETGNGQFTPSISQGMSNRVLSSQIQGGREWSGVSDLRSSSNIQSQGGIRDHAFSSNEGESLGRHRSPTDFMNGIRNQIQSLIRQSKGSDRTPEESNGYPDVRHDAATTSPAYGSQEQKRTFRPVEQVSSRVGVSGSLSDGRGLNLNVRERSAENVIPSNSFEDRYSRHSSHQGMRAPRRNYADGFEERKDYSKLNEADPRAGHSSAHGAGGAIDELSSRQLRIPRSLKGISTRQAEDDSSGFPDAPGVPRGSDDPSGIPEVPPSAGVHIGNGKLDGICIDNSTHCSCGMVNEEPKECLYVAKEDGESLLCVKQPCQGKLVCACAPGASSLCERSIVRDILVPATVHKHGDIEESEVVPCRRENLEHGITVLTPAA